MKRKIIVIIIVLFLICGCSNQKTEFIKYIQDIGFDSGDDTSSCYKNDTTEENINNYLRLYELKHGFEFYDNIFSISYSNNIYTDTDLVSWDTWYASYNYSEDVAAANIADNPNVTYIYFDNDSKIITKKFNSNTEDDCYTTSNSALIEKCEILQEKCRIVRGVFFNYLGDFEIDDIKEQN